MSNHPYRQKATNAPYPVDNNSSGSSFEDKPLEEAGNFNSDSSPRVDKSGPSTTYHSPLEDSGHFTNNNIAVNNVLRNDNLGAPYPLLLSDIRSPKFISRDSDLSSPTFNSREPNVVSPSSNPMSAASSVTNLNLSHPNVQDGVNKLEGNSTNPKNPTLAKFGHNRSVSSASSFFYEKSDNSSIVDFNQNLIQQYLGSNATHLLPRIKTIELYRKNAKKSSDPMVLFQYAQYMLQTALLLDANEPIATTSSTTSNASSLDSPKKTTFDKEKSQSSLSLATEKFKKSHLKSLSSNSLDASTDSIEVSDKRLKQSLIKEAVHYLRRLSDKGYIDAQYLLADAYSSGALGKVDNRDAFALFLAAAKHGHVESAYRTSYCYEEGLGTGRDARKAVEFLKMAASKNHPAAMYKLGVYSFHSRMGLTSNITTKKMGIKWLTRASNVANELTAAAPYELGKIYFDGFEDIVIPDKKYSLELYSQAAALGHVQAAALLGKFYEIGEVVPQDSNLSIHYYTQAALGGDPDSMLAMCAWYLVGNDPFLPKDDNEAFEWARRAAACGLPKAQYALANFYDKGIGCSKDTNEAQVWYKKAAENGDERSLSRINDKELVSGLQKKLKKKSFGNFSSQSLPQLSKTKASSQEKECVIM